MRNYVTPHCHIQSLDSASTPAAFVKRELELGTGVVTVTDHGSLAACHTTYELAKKAGLTPILGIEGYFRDDNCPILTAKGVEKKHPKKSRGGGEDTARPKGFQQYVKYHHITLHFQDYAAFQTGIKLLSKAPIELHGSEGKPLFTWHDLQELGATNTTMTTGCLIGMVQRHLLDHEDPVTARQYYEKLRGLVKPGNFYVEAFPHVCSHNWVEGVFLTGRTSNGDSKTLRYYAGKTLKTNVSEIKAEALAAAFKLKSNKHATLIAVKNRSKWEEIEPVEILEVNHNLGSFIQNECGPYSPDGDVQLGANRFVIDLANEYGDPILCSDDAHYAHKEERVVQEVRLAQAGNLRFYGNYHRQSSEEAFAYFNAKLGVKKAEFEKWVDNSHNWAEKFKGFKFTTETSIPSKFFEVNYRNVGASNSLEYTIYLIKKHGRMDWSNPERVARLEQEIKLLYQNGKIDLLPYFFVGELVCDAYRKAGLLTGPGRGSAAGLSLSYYLGITHVDPLRFGLSVDRFLTLDRILSGKLPDLDQDLPNRALLVGENDQGGLLQELFGDHVAQISTQTTLKLKSAVLDVARFKLGEVPKNIAALAHAFEVPPQGLDDDKFVHGYEDAGSWVEGSITRDKALQEYIRLYPEQWEVVKMCLGLGRGVGRHACAYVLANKPISDFIPLTKINGVTCTQFTAAAVEAVGGVKMDFLVLNSLNDISNTLALIKGTFKPGDTIINGIKVPEVQVVPDKNGNLCDIWNLPDDQDVFADIAQGKTETVFQFNTPSARNLLHHFAFRNDNGRYGIYSIESMAAFTALDRPGPLDISLRSPDGDGTHNAVVEYARRARGAAPSPDIPPIFNQLFPETHGILVFQEQLQRLYQQVTGCSGAEAEEFRSNVAKKKKEKVLEAYPKFIAGAVRRGLLQKDAEEVWELIGSWARYGFNLSHSVCYAVLAYACAWLKHHYPVQWWCSVLQNATKTDIYETFWDYCKDYVALPSLAGSSKSFSILNGKIQSPYWLIHGVGKVASDELCEIGPFSNITDLARKRHNKKLRDGRSGITQSVVYKLILIGVADSILEGGTPLDGIERFEQAVWEIAQEGKKKPSRIPPKLGKLPEDLGPFGLYQYRKSILPIYSADLLKPLVHLHNKEFVKHEDGRFRYKDGTAFTYKGEWRVIANMVPGKDKTIRRAVVAYLEAIEPFEFGGTRDPITRKRTGGSKAVSLTLDFDGERFRVPCWPDRATGEMPHGIQELAAGDIVVAILSKYNTSKRFSVEKVDIVKKGIGDATEEPETD
jgi:DNA polymerase III alpha subunit